MALLLILTSMPIGLHLFFFILYKRTNLKIQSTIYALITFVLLTIYWYIMGKNAGSGFLDGVFEGLFMFNCLLSAIIWFIALIKTTKNDFYLKTIDTVDKRSKILLYSFILNIFIIFIFPFMFEQTDIVYLIKNAISFYFYFNFYMYFAGGSTTIYWKIFIFLRIALLFGQFIFFVILDNKDLQNKKIAKEEEHRND